MSVKIYILIPDSNNFTEKYKHTFLQIYNSIKNSTRCNKHHTSKNNPSKTTLSLYIDRCPQTKQP